MNENLFETIRIEHPAIYSRMIGYSNDELCRLEKLYDIEINGQLRQFLSIAGRSDGGLIGDDPIILYRNSWSVRTHILTNADLFRSLQDIGAWDFLSNPFLFSIESETQYFYVRTGPKETQKDTVYHYDEDNKSVKSTGKTIFEYLAGVVQAVGVNENRMVCRGELLIT